MIQFCLPRLLCRAVEGELRVCTVPRSCGCAWNPNSADNLNTHTTAALYERFEPEEARRIAKKIEWHYTPEHGSWLNMAETELSTLSRQCLSRSIPNAETLEKNIAIWECERNTAQVTIDWQFTTADARIKLKRLYPQIRQEAVT